VGRHVLREQPLSVPFAPELTGILSANFAIKPTLSKVALPALSLPKSVCADGGSPQAFKPVVVMNYAKALSEYMHNSGRMHCLMTLIIRN
jgi:hypothetical protein